MTVDAHKLVRMGEQIAANLDFDDNPEALVERVADHLRRFWDPRMKAAISRLSEDPDTELSPVLRAAAARLES